MTMESPDRRTVLCGAALLGAGAALTACGGSSSGGAPKAGTSLGKAADIPMGSGKIFPDQKVVVTQLTAGDFKAYSAVCTHQGCIVDSIDTTEIGCSCHLSAYSIKDGSVVNGPAKRPLASETVTDTGGTLKLG